MSTKSSQKINIISDNNNFSFSGQEYYEYSNETHFWIKWRFKILMIIIRGLQIPIDEELLGFEIGCGNGILRNQLELATQWTIDGGDLDIEALRSNKEGKGSLFLYDIAERKEEFRNKYDFLVLYDVLEHIENPAQFLEACLFHLKKGGYLFINVPALENLMSGYDKANGHFRRYTKKSLEVELINIGLRLLDMRYWGFSLLPLLYLRKLLIPISKDYEQNIHKGFKPPNSLINNILKMSMNIETALFKRVLLGTSVSAVAIKA